MVSAVYVVLAMASPRLEQGEVSVAHITVIQPIPGNYLLGNLGSQRMGGRGGVQLLLSAKIGVQASIHRD